MRIVAMLTKMAKRNLFRARARARVRARFFLEPVQNLSDPV